MDDVLIKAIKKGVSDIHVEHFRQEPRIRLRLDGIMKIEKELTKFLIKNYNISLKIYKKPECSKSVTPGVKMGPK